MPRLCLAAAVLLAAGVCAAQDAGLAPLQSALDAARLGAFALSAPAVAAPDASKDPCAGGRMTPETPVRGEDGYYWAQSSVCLPYPPAAVLKASLETDTMVWEGVTKLNGSAVLESGPSGRRLRLEYESRKRYIGMCHTAHWPMEWTHRVVKGDLAAPLEAEISFAKVAGADFNGSFIKRWSGKITLAASPAGWTIVRMRYEIKAPMTSQDGAAAAVLAYFDRLKRRAAGARLPGPAANPDCPY